MRKYFQLEQKLIRALLLIVVLGLSSCVKEDGDELIQETSDVITWDVVTNGMQNSRALVENDDMLQTACSTGGKSIGIWSAYEFNGVVTKNVLGNSTGDVGLFYHKDTQWDNYKWWTYGVEAEKWVKGAKYTFNAYYPMNVVNEISSSDVSTFVIDYNTERYQEDLMTAYAFVDTKAPSFKTTTPVTLKMLHTLSALKFRFSFMNRDGSTYKDSDALTSFWLENTEYDKGFATTGVLAFGTINEDGSVYGEHIHWYHEDHPEPSTSERERKIYAWDDENGVNFSSTTSSRTVATAYSTNFNGAQKYSDKDGWVLTIPQELDGTSRMCFRLKSTGNLIHRVALPEISFEAGKRYIYDVCFSQSDVTLKISIADWNELKSSQDIPL